MSHVLDVDCYATDLDDLERAADRRGFILVRGATTYEWFGQWMNDYSGQTAAASNGYDPKQFGKCQHKLRLKDHQQGDYEIGLVPRLDGGPGWALLYDNWGSSGARLHARAGVNLEDLKNEILVEGSIREMKRKGYRVTRTDVNGEVKLRCSK